MNILSLIESFTNTFNEIFKTNFNPYNIEDQIKSFGDNFTINLLVKYLEELDLKFKVSQERKNIYNVKETNERTILTSIGYITCKMTRYKNKETNKSYIFLREILNLKPYQRMTDKAEFELINYAKEENMSQAAKHAIRNTLVSRSTVSKKIKNAKGTIHEEIKKTDTQPDVLFIEMDEIHANLQKGGNRICPCAIVHEGHEESFTKRKKLKNIHYFATAKHSYLDLWHVIYDYVDKKYDISKFKAIFVSGDGASGIKQYDEVFPNAIFVLDKFHYKKYLKYIFKQESDLMKLADDYIRNNNIEDFNKLVDLQIEKYPVQKKYMNTKRNYITNNLEGIKNQLNELYKCPCSMEGHVNCAYARYITSSPYGFSMDGLENKLQLLTIKANKHEITFDEFLKFKYEPNEYGQIISNINKIQNLSRIHISEQETKKLYDINVSIPIFDENDINNFFRELTAQRNTIKYI